jgi:hypothetical protein
MSTLGTCTVLPFYGLRSFTIIELAFAGTPISDITIVGGFIALDGDEFVFGVGEPYPAISYWCSD